MSRIARVVVDISLDREFDYVVPANLTERIVIGSRVLVPFGRSSNAGYVVGLPDRSDRTDLKEILTVIGDKPFLDDTTLALAKWISDYYCAPLEQAIQTVLPGAVRRKNARFKKQLAVSHSAAGDHAPIDHKLTPKQAAIMEILRTRGSMLLSDLLSEVSTTIAPVRTLEKHGLLKVGESEIRRDPFANKTVLPTSPLPLMPEQADALELVRSCIDQSKRDTSSPAGTVSKEPEQAVAGASGSRVVLLYGVTGSGKTEVYLQAIAHVIEGGCSAIVLVPEISLTPQTVERFAGRFGNRIAVLHSHLSDGERHDEWHRIRDGKADIVIGARSAIFAPVRNLGLIVVDEEHDPSYKQEESPRYNARDIAVMRGRMQNCAVVLGSATPSLESWLNSHNGKYRMARLTCRVDHRKMPVMRIVDMRAETAKTGRPAHFSSELLDAIKLRLERAEQTILFLNRRGFATSLTCPKCGYTAECEHCSVAYTYHRTGEELRCHICGIRKRVPPACPGCGDPAFKYAGLGTQKVEEIMRKCFPHARIQRMDADVTSRKDSYDRILGDFRVGKIDILIGTQMIAKGLHFPNVTLVGVVYADLSLHIPDFRAGERTYQLLAQVAGRAGRGEVSGEVIVQTYTPHYPAIQFARRLDFEGFCDQELESRRSLLYPPGAHLTCITVRGMSEQKVSYYTTELAKLLSLRLPRNVRVSKASPAPLARAKGQYRYQVIIRSVAMRPVASILKETQRTFKFPSELSCAIDVDAVHIM